VKVLLESGAAVDATVQVVPQPIITLRLLLDMTALLLACWNGREEIVDLLLSYGADLHAISVR
jgi:ankyrin repeat protein